MRSRRWGPNDGGRDGDGGGIKLKLSLPSFVSGLAFNFSNLFLMAKSTPGGLGAFFISSRAMLFFPTSSSFNKEPTIGCSLSNNEMSSKINSSGFCLLIIYFYLLDQAFAYSSHC